MHIRQEGGNLIKEHGLAVVLMSSSLAAGLRGDGRKGKRETCSGKSGRPRYQRIPNLCKRVFSKKGEDGGLLLDALIGGRKGMGWGLL